MVDHVNSQTDDESVPTISQLIAAQMDATGRSYRDMSRASGSRVKHQTFQELRNTPPKSWPKNVETIRGMSAALDVTEKSIVLAFARSLGVEVAGDSMLAHQLPRSAGHLGPSERNAIIALIRAITAKDSDAQITEPGTQTHRTEQLRTSSTPRRPGAPMKVVTEILTRHPYDPDDPDGTPPMPPIPPR